MADHYIAPLSPETPYVDSLNSGMNNLPECEWILDEEVNFTFYCPEIIKKIFVQIIRRQ